MSAPPPPPSAASPSSAPVRPVQVRVRLSAAGRGVLVFVCAALLVSWGTEGLLAVYAAAGLALFAVAPLLAFLHGRAVALGPPAPVTAFAGEPFPVDVVVHNRARLLAVRDLVLLHRGGRAETERPAGYAATVAPRASLLVPTLHRLLGRGRHGHLPLVAETSFPLGLAVCRLTFDLPVDVLVLPRLGTLRNLGALTARRHGLLYQGASDRGDEQEFHGLREWREGESQRRVHWRLSARRGRLLVREFRGEDLPPVHVVLDTRVPPRRRPGRERRGSFEGAVSLAATLVEHHLRRRHVVRFSALGPQPFVTDRRRGRDALLPILAALAELDASPLDGPRDVPLGTAGAKETVFLVCAGASSGTLRGLPPGGVVLDVERRATARVFVRARPGAGARLLGAGLLGARP